MQSFLAHLAVCGETFSLSFLLPYVDYLPKTVALKFDIEVCYILQEMRSGIVELLFCINMFMQQKHYILV